MERRCYRDNCFSNFKRQPVYAAVLLQSWQLNHQQALLKGEGCHHYLLSLPNCSSKPTPSTHEQTFHQGCTPSGAKSIESGVAGGHPESTCNSNSNSSSNNIAESSVVTNEEYADKLMARGSAAAKESDYAEATDCYSRALEIRAAHFSELAPECVAAYYKYGCALLYKAQEEADPLGSMPKKKGTSGEDSNKESSTKLLPIVNRQLPLTLNCLISTELQRCFDGPTKQIKQREISRTRVWSVFALHYTGFFDHLNSAQLLLKTVPSAAPSTFAAANAGTTPPQFQ